MKTNKQIVQIKRKIQNYTYTINRSIKHLEDCMDRLDELKKELKELEQNT